MDDVLAAPWLMCVAKNAFRFGIKSMPLPGCGMYIHTIQVFGNMCVAVD
jgi:hypothetical protein